MKTKIMEVTVTQVDDHALCVRKWLVAVLCVFCKHWVRKKCNILNSWVRPVTAKCRRCTGEVGPFEVDQQNLSSSCFHCTQRACVRCFIFCGSETLAVKEEDLARLMEMT